MFVEFLFNVFRLMKDIFKRIVISLVSGALIWYLLFLFFSNTVIVSWWYQEYNLWYYLILFAILLVLFIFFGIYPIHFKMTKWTLFTIWIFLILISSSVLVNDTVNKLYIWDLFKVLGVILTLLAWTNVLITSKVIKKSKEKNIEVIEV